jgi:hypothetical protein
MLRVRIQPAADDPALLEGLRVALAGELRTVPGLEAVVPEPAVSEAPGAKGDAVLLGGLIASGTLSTATLTAATKIIIAWLDRARARKVILTYQGQRLVLEAASASRQRAVTEAWLALVAGAAEPRPPESPAEG